jgi:quercetin dioxygenase-like cupin family protein
MKIKKVIKSRRVEGLKEEHFGEVFRQVLFSPSETGNNFLKMAYIDVPDGSKGLAHIHLGEEVVFTIKGKATLRINGQDYLLEEGSAFLIPPDVEHPATVQTGGNWVAVAAYCDECPILKKARGKEGIDYPVATGK